MSQTTPTPVSATEHFEIESFLTDYAHCIDDDQLEQWPTFFSTDAYYQIIPRSSHEAGHPVGVMQCQGRGMMQDRVRALREANIYEPHQYCHILSRASIAKLHDSSYQSRLNFQVVRTMQDGHSELFVSGRYLDLISSDGATFVLNERKVVLDSHRIDILLVFPL